MPISISEDNITMSVEMEKSGIRDDLISSKKTNYQTITISLEDKNDTLKHDSHHSNNGKSSVTSVLWNFLNITVGIGILSLPYAMVTTGLVSTIICLIGFGIICTYTLNLLVISAQKVSVFNYEGLAEHCYGSCGYFVASFFIFIMVFGGLITEFIAIGDASFLIMQLWGYDSRLERMIIMFIICVAVVLPMCLFRDLSSLEHVSALKVFSIVFIIGVVIYQWYTMTDDPLITQITKMNMNHITILNINGLPKTLGIIAFSFLCHDCVFLMYNTLDNPTLHRWKKVSGFGITGTITLNLLFSIPAFLTFGQISDPNVTNNYSITSPIFIAVRIVIIFIMALSYPPAFFVVRHIVYSSAQRMHASFKAFRFSISTSSPRSIMSHHQEINTRAIEIANKETHYTIQNAPLTHHILFTGLVFFSNLGIALFIDNLGIAMSLIGSISSMNLELVLPALFYMKICIQDETMFDPIIWKQSNYTQKLYLIITNGLFMPLCLVILGIILAITGVLSSLNMF
eukprot:276337_1